MSSLVLLDTSLNINKNVRLLGIPNFLIERFIMSNRSSMVIQLLVCMTYNTFLFNKVLNRNQGIGNSCLSHRIIDSFLRIVNKKL